MGEQTSRVIGVGLVLLTVVVVAAAYLGWQRANELETRVGELEAELASLEASHDATVGFVSMTWELLSDQITGIRDRVNAVDSDIRSLTGFGWSSFSSRTVDDLDQAVASVEACLDDLLDWINGFSLLRGQCPGPLP